MITHFREDLVTLVHFVWAWISALLGPALLIVAFSCWLGGQIDNSVLLLVCYLILLQLRMDAKR